MASPPVPPGLAHSTARVMKRARGPVAVMLVERPARSSRPDRLTRSNHSALWVPRIVMLVASDPARFRPAPQRCLPPAVACSPASPRRLDRRDPFAAGPAGPAASGRSAPPGAGWSRRAGAGTADWRPCSRCPSPSPAVRRFPVVAVVCRPGSRDRCRARRLGLRPAIVPSGEPRHRLSGDGPRAASAVRCPPAGTRASLCAKSVFSDPAGGLRHRHQIAGLYWEIRVLPVNPQPSPAHPMKQGCA